VEFVNITTHHRCGRSRCLFRCGMNRLSSSPGRRGSSRGARGNGTRFFFAMLLDKFLMDLLKLGNLLTVQQTQLQANLGKSWISRRTTHGHRSLDLCRGQHLELDCQASHQRYRLRLGHLGN
jgi:hypothetical protein